MRISVVIPSFNHEHYVAEAIRSVAQQHYPDLEIVVVDDGSTDGSAEQIRSALARAKGTVGNTAFLQQENAGAHAAITSGIELSSGPWLSILNSDDFYLPGRLQRAADCAGDRREFLIFTRVAFVDASSHALDENHAHRQWYQRILAEARSAPTVGFALLRNNYSVTSGNLIFSRELYERVGGFRPYRFCHDWDFAMRSTHRVEPDFIDEELMGYRVHSGNASHSLRKVQEDEARDALMSFLDLCASETPLNPQAPCPQNWTRFFELFVTRYSFHFGTRAIVDYMK